MAEFRYRLHSGEKFDCPECHEAGRFVKYIDVVTGEYLEGDYGKCDRVNSCGYELRPNAVKVKEDEEIKLPVIIKDLYESDNYSDKHYEWFRHRHNKPNTFMRGLVKHFGEDQALDAWDRYRLGNFFDGGVVFPYIFQGNVKSGKIMWYGEDLHRKKDMTIWLHNYGEDGRYKCENGKYAPCWIKNEFKMALPLFGWDLIETNDKPICLVESEKTAVIGSIAFPEYNWVGVGGLWWLGQYKFPYNSKRQWIILPDLGTMLRGDERMTVSDFWKERIESITNKIDMLYYFPDYYPDIYDDDLKQIADDQQWDIGDFIMQGMENNNLSYIEQMENVFKVL